MYDTGCINLPLQRSEHVLQCLTQRRTSLINDSGNIIENGSLENLNVFLSQDKLLRISGSLAKFYYGSNLFPLSLSDTKRVIEKLSDLFHLDVAKGHLTRIDYGVNVLLNNPVEEYLNTFAESDGYTKNIKGQYGSRTISYKISYRDIKFYDKIAEINDKKHQRNRDTGAIKCWHGFNILRYEASHIQPRRDIFKGFDNSVALLCNTKFYRHIQSSLIEEYKSIPKQRIFRFEDQRVTCCASMLNSACINLCLNDALKRDIIYDYVDRNSKGRDHKSKMKRYLREKWDSCMRLEERDNIIELDKKIYEAIIIAGLL